MVAPGEDGVRRADSGGREAEQQRQGPPALAGVGVHALVPPDRGEPGPGSARHVPDGAQGVRRPEHRAGETVGTTGAPAQLHRQERHRPERQAAGGRPHSQHERSGGGQTVGHQTARDPGREQEVRAEDDDQGRGRRGPTAQGAGAQQLVAPRLLLGAGVPADQQHAHQPGQDGSEGAGLPGHLATGGVQGPRRAGHRDERGVAAHRRRGLPEGLPGGVDPVDAGRLRPVEQRRADDEPADQPAVASQEAAQDHPARDVHRGAHAGASWSCSTSSP